MTQNAFADLGAEKSCIGSLLQDASCLRLLDELRPEDFTSPVFADIFRAAASLRARRQPVDMQTVLSELQQRASAATVSDLADAVRYVPTTANVDAYVQIVRERSRRRDIRSLCERTIAALSSDGADVAADMAADGFRGMIGGCDTRISAAQVMAKTYDLLESISQGKTRAIPTPYADLNGMISGGLRKGEMTVLAAYTGQGKSALAQEVVLHAARKGFRVLLVSCEMGPEQYGLRAFSSLTGLDVEEMLNAKRLSPEQWGTIAAAVSDFSKLPVDYTFTAYTVEDVRREVRRMKGIDLLVVDYLQILETEDRYPTDNSRVARISRVLKTISREMQIPVLALSQFSRPQKGVVRRPQVNDLRDSGSIEQDADNIWLMWQPTGPEDSDIPPQYAGWFEATHAWEDRFLLLDVAKQRMGRLGIIALGFSPQRMKFYTPKPEKQEVMG